MKLIKNKKYYVSIIIGIKHFIYLIFMLNIESFG